MAKPQRRRRQDEDKLKRAQTANQKARAQLREEQEKQSRTLENNIKKNITMLSRNLVSPAEEARRDTIGFEIALELLKVEGTVSKTIVEERRQILTEYEESLTSLYEQKRKNTIFIVETFRKQIDTIFKNSQKEPLNIRSFAIEKKYIKQIDIVIENIKNFKSPDLQENIRQLLLKDAEYVKQTFKDSISIFGKVKSKTKAIAKNITKDFRKNLAENLIVQGALGSQGLAQSGLGKLLASKIQERLKGSNADEKTIVASSRTARKLKALSYEQDILQQKQEQLSPEAITLDPSQDGTGTTASRGRRGEVSEAPERTRPSTRLGIVARTKGLEQQTFNIKIEKILLRHQGLLECICENSKTIVQDLELRRRQKQEAQDESAFETQETLPTATRDAEKETDKKKKGIFGLLAAAGMFLLNKLKSLTGFFTKTVTTLLKSVWKLLTKPFRLLAGLVRQVLSSVGKTLLRLGAQLLARITAFALSPAAIFAAAGAAGAYATAKIGEAIGGKASGTLGVYKKAQEYGLSQEGGTVAISKRIRDYERAKNLPISKQGRLFNENGKIVEVKETDSRVTGKPSTAPTSSDILSEKEEEFETADSVSLSRRPGETQTASRMTTESDGEIMDYLIFNQSTGASLQAFKNLDPDVQHRTLMAAKEYKEKTGKKLTINSAYRTQAEQDAIYEESVRAGRPGKTKEGYDIAKKSLHTDRKALDIQNYRDPIAVAALNRVGLFQNVPGDYPHFALGNATRVQKEPPQIQEISLSNINMGYDKRSNKINKKRSHPMIEKIQGTPAEQRNEQTKLETKDINLTPEVTPPSTSSEDAEELIPSFSIEDGQTAALSMLEKGVDQMIEFLDPTQQGRRELTAELGRSAPSSSTGNIDSSTTVAQTNQNNFYGGGLNGAVNPVSMEPLDPSLRSVIHSGFFSSFR